MVSVIQPRSATRQQPTVVASQPSLADVWRGACDELSLPETRVDSTDLVHDVGVCLHIGQGTGVQTEYSSSLDAPGLPQFSLSKRQSRADANQVRTGDATFDQSVVIKTDEPLALAQFMNAERRIAVMQLLGSVTTAEISNRKVVARSKGIERDGTKVHQTMHRLLEVAEALRPCWTDVALDEGSVVDDLFHARRDLASIEQRFNEFYWGNEVTWTGEVLTTGATEHGRQRAAVLIGASHGQASTGRVVALAALDAGQQAVAGDVVSVVGTMWDLNADKRLFTIE